MLKDITIGQFFPGDSIVHRTDPRVKILITIFFVVILFMVSGFLSYIYLGAFLLSVVMLSKIKLKLILRGLKPILFIVIFTAVLNIFYTAGEEIFSIFIFTATKEGVQVAIFMIIRIVMLIMGTSMLTYTTSPILLTDALEKLMSPLKKIKAPVHELSMMMTIALRFIPTLISETEKIMNAQKARGADFETGSLVKRAKALVPILVPLFISAFRRADELATAMECRLYRGDVGRTRMRQLKLCKTDIYVSVFCCFVFAGAIVVSNINYIIGLFI